MAGVVVTRLRIHGILFLLNFEKSHENTVHYSINNEESLYWTTATLGSVFMCSCVHASELFHFDRLYIYYFFSTSVRTSTKDGIC